MNGDLPQEEALQLLLQLLQEQDHIASFEKLNRAKRRQLDRMGALVGTKKVVTHVGRFTCSS